MRQVILAIALSLSLPALGSLSLKTTIDGEDKQTMGASKPAVWDLRFMRMDGSQHQRFMPMHAKPMHMIVVNRRLSHFAHIHPSLKDDGTFSIKVNAPTEDPDNFDVHRALPYSDRYFVFTEAVPLPINDRMPMAMHRFAVDAVSPRHEPPTPTRIEDTVRYFKQDGTVGQEGDLYRVEISYENFLFCRIYMPKFYLDIQVVDDAGEYHHVEDWQKWLGMGGHAVLISHFGEELSDKEFQHLHAFMPTAADRRFVLPYHNHRRQMPKGDYRVWGQFRRHDRVYTFTFDQAYDHPPLPETSLCN